MNQKERLLKALALQPVDRPPAAVPTQNAIEEVMEKSGYKWPEALRKASAMAGLAWACHEIGGIESVRVPFDITIEAEAMGCETRFGEEATAPPMSMPKSRETYHTIRIPDPLRDGRMPEVLEAITLLREKAGDEVPVIAALGTPFELLSTTLSFEDITMALYKDPDFLLRQMEIMTGIAKSYAAEIEKRNPDVLMLVDGTSQALGPSYYTRFSFPYTREMVQALQKPAVLHICGNATPLLDQMVATGVKGLSIDKPVDTEKARRTAAGKAALVGNISPHTLCLGSKQEIEAETMEALRSGMQVVAPGCGILPQTSLENLQTYIRCVTEGCAG
ncbi:MAG: MtaA/CmuA family methyltransferase [Alphaproteobacteria bacterium]|uniref:MtaA/CmuA family methyltransferase n=1 Tax=Candidatus Nitrobium versatile TaxID=2884831 RepID=A0A953J4U4_9BACT|nr:MtaA/CmuA family methyltransferase [Candidatus Nitrobium versatile]